MVEKYSILDALTTAMAVDSPGRVYACGAIWGLSINRDNRLVIIDHEALTARLIENLHTASGKVLSYSCLAVQNLASSEENRTLMVAEMPFLPALIAVLVSQQSVVAVESSLMALKYLAADERNRVPMVNEEGLVSCLTNILKNGSGKPRLMAASVLHNLGHFDSIFGPTARTTTLQSELEIDNNNSGTYREKGDDSDFEEGNVYESEGREKYQPKARPESSQAQQPQPTEGGAETETTTAAAAAEAEKEEEVQEDDDLVAAERARYCTRVMNELIDTEKAYVNSLQNLKDLFEEPLVLLKNASQLQVPEIFRDISPILVTHRTMCEKLQAVMKEAPRPEWPMMFANILIEMTPFLKQVSPFIDRFENVMSILEPLNKDKNAQKILMDARIKCGLDLQSHLIMPVQRIPRLEMLLKDLIKHTNKGRRDYKRLTVALTHIREVALYCNEQKRLAERRYKQNAIALKIKGMPLGVNVMESGRFFMDEGRVVVVAGPGRLIVVNYFLFNDIILFTENRDARGDQQLCKGHVILKGIKVEPITENDIKTQKLYAPRVLRHQGFDLMTGIVVKADKKVHYWFPVSADCRDTLLAKLKEIENPQPTA
eukprot:c6500_g1_i1.p1 GENE.c6500_g1_i1~~c6500_g1_i1.p1  ORF type:complete len:689 (-),score=218.06 c6500_g1_i1:5-1807(-)